MKQGRTSEAIDLIEKEEPMVGKIEKYNIRLKCLKIAALAFQGDTTKLHKELPPAFTKYSNEAKYFFLFYYAIYFFLAGQIPAAIRELDNFAIVLKKQPSVETTALQPIIRFLKQYFLLQQQMDIDKQTDGLTRLRMDMNNYKREATVAYRGYLPLLWLEGRMDD
ncbi:MAG: hypothetical protein AAF960_03100 [Bacteroidota bacterium]